MKKIQLGNVLLKKNYLNCIFEPLNNI